MGEQGKTPWPPDTSVWALCFLVPSERQPQLLPEISPVWEGLGEGDDMGRCSAPFPQTSGLVREASTAQGLVSSHMFTKCGSETFVI